MNNVLEEMKPCPKCGSNEGQSYGTGPDDGKGCWHAGCDDCEFEVQGKTLEEVIDLWQRLKPVPKKLTREQVLQRLEGATASAHLEGGQPAGRTKDDVIEDLVTLVKELAEERT